MPDWLRLEGGKSFSRLLYPNPVCFLTIGGASSFESGSRDRSPGEDAAPAAAVTTIATAKNAMVLSWLTPTNNEGRFMFSINRRRHTASLLVPGGSSFVLSVPVKGMEQLILDVGGASGRWGCKFPADRGKGEEGQQAEESEGGGGNAPTSNRQKKRARQARLASGVPGLVAVPLGMSRVPSVTSPSKEPSEASSNEQSMDVNEEVDQKLSWGTTSESAMGAFAIDGTVAHLHCRTYHVVSDPNDAIDSEHHLVLAEVTSAYVCSSYWDPVKLQFRPETCDTPPYLTFLGSQTFGYVCCEGKIGPEKSPQQTLLVAT